MEPAAAATAQRLPEPGREDRASAPAAAAAALAAAAGGGRSLEPALTPGTPSGGNGGGGAREEAPGEAPLGPLPGRAGGTGRRRRRGAPLPNAGGAAPVPGAGGGTNSLLLRRGRLKRNLSAAAAAASSSSSLAAAASHSPSAAGLPASCSASASLCTRSLDRKTLLLKHRQTLQLQPSDRDWVRHQLQRGCVHVFDRHMASTYLRPVLCTLDTTAGEVAARLLQLGHKGGGVVKVLGQGPGAAAAREADEPPLEAGPRLATPEPPDSEAPPARSAPGAVGGPPCAPPADLPLPAGGPGGWTRRASPAPSDFSPGEPFAEGPASPPHGPRPVASDTESFSLSPSAESVSDRLDPYSSGGGSSSSSEELEADPASAPMGVPGPPRRPGRPAQPRPPSQTASLPPPQQKAPRAVDSPGGAAREEPCREKTATVAAPGGPQSTPRRSGATAEKAPPPPPPPTLYVQLHGETTRRLEAEEKPLQIQNDYLFQLGFGELWRVQEEGMDSEIGCLIRFYAGKESTYLDGWVQTLPRTEE
ncbi:PH domain leucine-rich repeat-containing protein phosphatase 1 [Saguinus oedipus]|uniref:PH domain leucine-rich repeat-containing protein phosphatase 1 n=1 Tax=Saguinus oedipus TaxID=9490 RepID=A0ABQ9UC20_SAGOE|nr:PH domain leucine-rich repeat-containing protein phosphatase 1 [Saguinus oedipus]